VLSFPALQSPRFFNERSSVLGFEGEVAVVHLDRLVVSDVDRVLPLRREHQVRRRVNAELLARLVAAPQRHINGHLLFGVLRRGAQVRLGGHSAFVDSAGVVRHELAGLRERLVDLWEVFSTLHFVLVDDGRVDVSENVALLAARHQHFVLELRKLILRPHQTLHLVELGASVHQREHRILLRRRLEHLVGRLPEHGLALLEPDRGGRLVDAVERRLHHLVVLDIVVLQDLGLLVDQLNVAALVYNDVLSLQPARGTLLRGLVACQNALVRG